MDSHCLVLCKLILVMCSVYVSESKNILGLFPSGIKSHFEVTDAVMKELARRGHNVTVVSPFRNDQPLANYTLVEINKLKMVNVIQINEIDSNIPTQFFDRIHVVLNYIESDSKALKTEGVLNLLTGDTKFDVIFVELFVEDTFLLFAKKFNVPVIGISTCYPLPWSLKSFAAPQTPSYIPSLFSGSGKNMNLFERLVNTYRILYNDFVFQWRIRPKSVEVFKRQLGNSEVSISEAVTGVSLFLVNTHWSYHGVRPYPPQVVEVGGIHVQPARPLAQDLDRWMNESTHGVVYFSFGSMMKGATLPADKVQAFLQVFGSLPQRVLWKWEDDAVKVLPANVKVMKWLPQRDILGHPNVKAFISHGGLLGTTEAVVSGVPILGIPMFGDQPNNIAALVDNGVAVRVDYNNISVTSLTYALNALLNDKSYRENAAQLSRRFLDRPMSPLDTAVYWTEYVMRHGGAPHLRSAAVSLSWYQYYLLDVAAVCLVALLAVFTSIYYSMCMFLRILVPAKPVKLKSN